MPDYKLKDCRLKPGDSIVFTFTYQHQTDCHDDLWEYKCKSVQANLDKFETEVAAIGNKLGFNIGEQLPPKRITWFTKFVDSLPRSWFYKTCQH